MRPYSEIRLSLAAALLEGRGTTKQLAQRTGWSIDLTMRTLDNMVRSGDARKTKSVRVPGVKRPVPVYERAVRAVDQADDFAEPYQTLFAAWAGLAVAQHTEAAM